MSIFGDFFNKQRPRRNIRRPTLYTRLGKGRYKNNVNPTSTEPYQDAASIVPRAINVNSNNSSLVFAANPRRKYLLIQNLSANSIVINFGSSAQSVPQKGFAIFSNGNYEPSVVPTNTVEIIGVGGVDQEVIVAEGI